MCIPYERSPVLFARVCVSLYWPLDEKTWWNAECGINKDYAIVDMS